MWRTRARSGRETRSSGSSRTRSASAGRLRSLARRPRPEDAAGAMQAERGRKRHRPGEDDGLQHETAVSVAELCREAALETWRALPRKGKPQPQERTVMAAICLVPPDGAPRCVALGTGTKCLGRSMRDARGSRLADSHAEVLARRAFLRWVVSEAALELLKWLANANDAGSGDTLGSGAVEWRPERGTFSIRDGVKLWMYVTQPPCGDAAILADAALDQPRARAAGLDCAHCGANTQQEAAALDVCARQLRTGAKAIKVAGGAAGTHVIVPEARDVDGGEQEVGVCRRKPGKGDATLSMSCSDKIAKWVLLGLQGSLLAGLFERPVHLAGLVTDCPEGQDASGPAAPPSARTESDQGGEIRAAAAPAEDLAGSAAAALRRALQGRIVDARRRVAREASDEGPEVELHVLPRTDSAVVDGFAHGQQRTIFSGTCVSWSRSALVGPGVLSGVVSALQERGVLWAEGVGALVVTSNAHEATLGGSGRKQGSGKADDAPRTWSLICRAAHVARFVTLAAAAAAARLHTGGCVATSDGCEEFHAAAKRLRAASYGELKQSMPGSRAYMAAWDEVRAARPFDVWIRKPPQEAAVAVADLTERLEATA